MKNRAMRPAALIVTCGAILGLSLTAQAKDASNDAVATLAEAKISIIQAIEAAQARVDGKVSHAVLKSAASGAYFDIEVVAGQEVSDLKVSAADGSILAVHADQADHDEDSEDGEAED